MDNNTQSPFAAPQAAPAPSPFAAPTPAAAAPQGAVEYGDTSFLDTTSSREPLVKSCTVPGVICDLTPKRNEETGKQSVAIAVQIFGENMVYDNGDPVSPGKRLTTTIFAPLDTPEKKARSERKLKGLILALNNIVADGRSEIAAYAALPQSEKLGLLLPNPQHPERTMPEWSFHALLPPTKWVGTKVMVQVTTGKDMDGNPRNEFTLLAASTKPVERKSR